MLQTFRRLAVESAKRATSHHHSASSNHYLVFSSSSSHVASILLNGSIHHHQGANYHINIPTRDENRKEDTLDESNEDESTITGNENEISDRILNKLKQYTGTTEDVAIDFDVEEAQRLAQEESNKRTYRREYDLLWEEEREPPYFRNTVQGKKIADIPCIFDMIPYFADRISPVITKPELEEIMKKPRDVYNYLVVDVRSAFRALDYMIPGAVNIPFTEIKEGSFALKAEAFNKRYNAPLPEEYTNIICYSDNPAESEAACLMLQDMGFQNTINYRGGCSDWFGNEFKVLWRKKRLHRLSGEKIGKMIALKEKTKEKLNNPPQKE
ncbi:hypothetical protein FDP41_003012 [Naegleria fowleri]|uniref:Rhodanese domain-containing protein n=1 Tax=Naegleria fowleri TaxID=5763 RepID=A0A6A5BVC0_NAEFO|nr:uncharacterized protein FDP41_003012 [Naegleria fowleri]KAF0977690.1 hypothetical protein FDP41_003012 [Naegleria fowleri]CAG4710392.1 unnamed protein product [Naegleria fowleri]